MTELSSLINESRRFSTWFLQITTPKTIQKCAGVFLSSREIFFCRNLKNARMSFLGRCNVETASSGPLLLKSGRVWGWFIHQLFKGYIFCFHVHSDGRYIFELSAHDQIWWKSTVWVCSHFLFVIIYMFTLSRQHISNVVYCICQAFCWGIDFFLNGQSIFRCLKGFFIMA